MKDKEVNDLKYCGGYGGSDENKVFIKNIIELRKRYLLDVVWGCDWSDLTGSEQNSINTQLEQARYFLDWALGNDILTYKKQDAKSE